VRPLFLCQLYLTGILRRQLHLATLLLAILLLILPAYVDAFSMGLHSFERVAKEFGLTAISYFAVAMAIMLGCTSIPADLESRALYPILARPLSRGSYMLAHFLALLLWLGGSLLLLLGCFCLALRIKTGHFDTGVAVGVYGAFLQAMVVGTVCLVFSVRCSPPLAGTIGAAVFLVGNLSGAFIRFFLVEDRESIVSATLAKTLKGIMPNLSLFALKDPAVHSIALPSGYLAAISYNALIWVVILLLLAQLAFQRVDL